MLLQRDAIHSFFGTLEDALSSFIDLLVSNETKLRYTEIKFFTALRLALYVKGTTFICDEGTIGASTQRVRLLLDRLVLVLAGVAVLRYMQDFLGEAAARWWQEETEKGGARWEMWFSVWQLWKAGMSGLASPLAQGRHDVGLSSQQHGKSG